MNAPRFIKSGRLSQCHNAPSLLVRSREGGFVSQNCLKCGHPNYVSIDQLPKLICEICYGDLKIGTNRERNYEYSCPKCERKWVLADKLPHWSDLFAYCGLFASEGEPPRG